MLSSIVHNPCEAKLHLYSSDFFYHPKDGEDHEPGKDMMLYGLVEVRVPSERTIHGIRVSFSGLQTICIPQKVASDSINTVMRYENRVLIEKVIEIKHDERKKSAHASGPPLLPGNASKAAGVVEHSATTATNDGAGASASNGKAKAVDDDDTVRTEGLHLEKGVHSFEFSFIVPPNLPPFERSKYGRVRYTLTATVLGGGRGRTNITTSREIFLIAQVEEDGGAVDLDMRYNDAHEALGPISIGLSSASLTVGGVATLSVYHPSPPPGLNVHVIRAFIEQTTELYSSTLKSSVKLPVEKLRIWERGYHPYREPARQVDFKAEMEDSFWIADEDGQGSGHPGRAITESAAAPTLAPFGFSALATDHSPAHSRPTTPGLSSRAMATGTGGAILGGVSGTSDSGYKIKAVLRMPDDNTMRPSSVAGSKADIKIKHNIGVEVYFSRVSVLQDREDNDQVGKPKVQLFSMRRPANVQSCCSTFDHIHLPPYTFESPMSSRPPSPTVPISRNSMSDSGPGNLSRGRPGPPSRQNSQSEIDHYKLKQTLKAALGGHAGMPGGSGHSSSGLRSGDRSGPNSRAASRNSSPTRQGGMGSYFGRRSRPSSPTRGHHSHEGSGMPSHSHSQSSSLSTSPTSVHHPMARRGYGGLHALTPSNRPSPQAGATPAGPMGAPSTTPGHSPTSPSVPLPVHTPSRQASHSSALQHSTSFPSVVTAPMTGGHASSSTALGAAPTSLPPNSPWALGGFPERSATSHDNCQCGKTTEELIEAEHRFREGAPTAPGMWITTHDEDEAPPPWMPSRPASPDFSSGMAGMTLQEGTTVSHGDDPATNGPPSYTTTTDVDGHTETQDVSGWHRTSNGLREGGRRRQAKVAEVFSIDMESSSGSAHYRRLP